MNHFKDHFSTQSQTYSQYRPEYPQELFQYLSKVSKGNQIAWDCATGNGQAARGLSPFFNKIWATDASEQQILNASGPNNIEFIISNADSSGLNDGSVDLVTVAQALHWFDLDPFYTEVRRVLKLNGILAVWCYGLMKIDDRIDPLFYDFYNNIVGPFWPKERIHIENGYADLSFPFQKLSAPPFNMKTYWSLDDFLGYLRTWSATVRYIKQNGQDPVSLWQNNFQDAWGKDLKKEMVWPLTVLIGQNLL